MTIPLNFRADDSFVIVQFTDLHWQNGEAEDLLTRRLMELVLGAEQPDLVVFTGDVIDSQHCLDPRASFRQAVACVEAAQIPWAAVFGNHDSEANVTRSDLMQIQRDHAYCVATASAPTVSGVGNYVLPVYAHGVEPAEADVAAALYCFDSGSYAPLPTVGGYDWIRRDQIAWYAAESARLSERNHGMLRPALAFFHIPLPEYNEAWHRDDCVGHKLEDVCCPRVNTGLFSAFVEAGDVMGTFVGHDHVNDFSATLHDVRLCYGRATGFHTYGRDGFQRGARVIQLKRGQRNFATWLRLEDGTVLHQQATAR